MFTHFLGGGVYFLKLFDVMSILLSFGRNKKYITT